MKNVVLFSGGLDSTLTVLSLAKQMTVEDWADNQMYLLYHTSKIDIDEPEESAAYKIVKRLKRDFPKIEFVFIPIETATQDNADDHDYYDRWYFEFIRKGLEILTNDKKPIEMYVSHSKDSSLSNIRQNTRMIIDRFVIKNDLKNGSIRMITKWKHERMYEIVKNYTNDPVFIKYLELVWLCEYPQGVVHSRDDGTSDTNHCGYCDSCQQFINILSGLVFGPTFNDIEKLDTILYILRKRFKIDLLDSASIKIENMKMYALGK